MNHQNQSRQEEDSKGLDILLLLVAALIAWPALLLGMITRWQIKQRTTDPSLYWIGAGIMGALGVLVLAMRENPYPFFLILLSDLTPLVSQMSMLTFTHLLRDAIPLWERSLFVFPWFSLLIELFSPKNLRASLLAQERHRRAIQASKSKRAAHKARKAPDQVNGKGVLGVLIDNPNT